MFPVSCFCPLQPNYLLILGLFFTWEFLVFDIIVTLREFTIVSESRFSQSSYPQAIQTIIYSLHAKNALSGKRHLTPYHQLSLEMFSLLRNCHPFKKNCYGLITLVHLHLRLV